MYELVGGHVMTVYVWVGRYAMVGECVDVVGERVDVATRRWLCGANSLDFYTDSRYWIEVVFSC